MIKANLRANNLVLVLGSAFFLLAGAFAIWLVVGGSQQDVLAEVAHERGYAWKTTGFGATKTKITNRIDWTVNQTLITDPIGQLRIFWLKDKSEWLVLEGSEVSLFKLGQVPIIKIKSGEITPLKWSKKEIFKIQQTDGRIVEISEYLGAKDQVDEVSSSSEMTAVDSNQVIGAAIERTRPQLIRCYSKHMSSEGLASRFAITARFNYSSRLGVSQLSLQSVPPLEGDLEKCLMDILTSLSMPQYRGPAIDIEVPIEFE